MTDDLLERATRALRDESDRSEPRSGLTRARILDGAEKRYGASRKSPFVRWAIAVAALFAASTALARVAQQYWPEIQRVLSAAPAAPKPSARPRAKQPVPQPQAAGAAAPELPPQAAESQPLPLPQAETPPAPPRPRPTPARHPRRAERPRVTPAAPAAPPAEPVRPATAAGPPPESAELSLFRRAQRLHIERDSGALAAWDAYLRVAGDGVLAPEARYNRALCLVRLGRASEARAALEPFARGAYGGFRKREASELLDVLSRPRAGSER